MAINIGDAFLGTGFATRIFTEFDNELATRFPDDYDSAAAEEGLKAMSNALAKAIRDELQANLDLHLSGVQAGVDNVDVNGPGAVD